MEAWYLIYSKFRQEKVAFFNLSRQGFTAYFPQIRRQYRGRRTGIVQPAFPRYLFVQLNDKTDDWSSIRSTRGVSNLVRFGNCPARVPDGLVAALRGMENEQGIREYFEPAFQPGDYVRISDGVLRGYVAVFQASSGNERVRLLLDAAGTSARLEINASQIEYATSSGGRASTVSLSDI